ncbi:MAG TPA: polysaccharide deacetylase family protein [Gemmatimonadaceae bacterium]|nr:polysaccharide deacetylase family protein [Gemmatimonadaceae bacterium]
MRTLREFRNPPSAAGRLRDAARSAIIGGLSLVPRHSPSAWVRFPYYHYVFDDERRAFAAQLAYLRNRGEFISIDRAVALLRGTEPVDGRYFCITFDDGFRNCLTNAVPILLEHGAVAAFFVTTDFVGASPLKDPEQIRRVSNGGPRVPDFLSWQECREMILAGMTIGSHTVSHRRLSTLSDAEAEVELRESKVIIERELGTQCHHFSCPKGGPERDFRTGRDPVIARRLGYASFLTTQRGSVHRLSDPFLVERDHLLAAWGTHQLRYFFSR